MSANQIPYLGPKLTDDEWFGKPRPHSCPRCVMNGGEGHSVRELQKLRRDELDYAQETPIVLTARRCGYWSARERKHCDTTEKVRVFPGLGQRCPSHDPGLLNTIYKTLMENQ